MQRAFATLIALLIGAGCGLLLGNLRQDVYAQGKGGGKGGGGGNVQCSIASVIPVAFGTYDSLSPTPTSSTGTLTFSCKPPGKTVTVKITIGASAGSGSITDRSMLQGGGSDELRYNLFQDQRGSVIWGDDVNGGSSLVVTGSQTFSLEIYGIAWPAQAVSEGSYFDTLTITIQP